MNTNASPYQDKIVSAVLIASFLTGLPMTSFAAQCRDAKGKFIRCPPPAVAPVNPKAQPCRDAKGKFIKCPTAPVPKGPCRDPNTGKFIKCK
jgi:hypothetical protein